jgi:hypothetical protein
MYPYKSGTLVRGATLDEGGPATMGKHANEWGMIGDIMGQFGEGDLGIVLRARRMKGTSPQWVYKLLTSRGMIGWTWSRLVKEVR